MVIMRIKIFNLSIVYLSINYFNFEGLVDFVAACYHQKCNHDSITAQGIKFSADPYS